MTMTKEQKELLDKLELGLAHMIHDKHKDWAENLGPIVEYLQKGEPEMAVLEGDARDFTPEILDEIRRVFGVLY